MNTKPLIAPAAALQIAGSARDAELNRNLDQIRQILEPVWPDIDHDPDFSVFPTSVNAHLKRVAGFFLSLYGKSRNVPNFQVRGRNLITSAIGLFENLSQNADAVEARIILAVGYWHSGEVAESDAILDEVEREIAGQPNHPAYLQHYVNRLMLCYWGEDLVRGRQIIHMIGQLVAGCDDRRLVTLYHMNAGGVLWRAGSLQQAIDHFAKAVRVCDAVHNYHLLAWNLNNLACCYKDVGQIPDAHRYIEKAIGLFEDLHDRGSLAVALDTKALILFEERNYDDALTAVNTALDILAVGEDAAAHAESLWTKCRCLFKLGRVNDAFALFGELQYLAAHRIGKVASDKYARAIAVEMGFSPEQKGSYGPGECSGLSLDHGFALVNDPALERCFAPEVRVLYCVPSQMEYLGIDGDALVTLRRIKPRNESVVLFRNGFSYRFARVRMDRSTQLLFADVDGVDGPPPLVADLSILGVCEMYCTIDSLDFEDPGFTPLPVVY